MEDKENPNRENIPDKVAEDLRKIGQRFSSLLMATSEVLYQMSPDWSEMIQLNSRGFLKNTEKPNSNWLHEYIPPDDQPRVTRAINEAIRTKSVFELEHHVWQEDGSIGWTFSRALPVLDENGEIVEWIGSANNITRRKKAEEQMRAAKEQYDLLFNSVNEGFALYKAIRDENNRLYDIQVLEINPAGAAHTGVKRDDQTGKTWLQLWDGDIPDSLFEIYRQVDESGTPQYFEHFSPITNRWYSNSLNKIDYDRFAVVFFDITELKRVSAELNQIRNSLEAKVQERTSELIEVNELLKQNANQLNILNRTITVANGSKDVEELAREVIIILLDMMDFDGGGLYLIFEKENIAKIVYSKGLSGEFIKCIDNIDLNQMPYNEVLVNGNSFFFDKADISKIGSDCLNEYDVIVAVPVYSMNKIIGSFNLASKKRGPIGDEEKKILNSIGREIGTTITKLMYESEMERLIGELKRSNADLQHFAYVASHDLQEPLRTIASFTQLLVKRYRENLDNDAIEFMDLIVDASTLMQQMIIDLLEYSRIGTQGNKLMQINTVELVEQVRFSLKDLIERNQAEVTYDTLPVLNIGKDHFHRVFQNLIGNAIKFRKAEVPPKVHVSSRKDGNEYIFSVSDNGIGIEDKYFDRIFTIFQRLHTRDKYEGTGMGLAIIKRIVESYKGRIWVESTPGVGSTFYFTIPYFDSAQ